MNLFDFIEPAKAAPPAPKPSKQALVAELTRYQREIRRQTHFRDGVAWAEHRLGDKLWSGQRTILQSVSRNRRTAVMSCHEIGKSFTASVVVSWWLDRDKTGDAFVVTSAPTGPQVKAILWREIQRAHTRGKLRGRVNQTSWFMPTPDGKEELVAFGRKPDDYDPTAFQGIHAPRVLVVFDEACGMPASLWEAADSLIANNESKILVIGNPDDPQTQFAEICKPGSGWNVISISAFDSPNFTGEAMPPRVLNQLIGHTYVEEKRRKWAPRWQWVDASGNTCPPNEGVRCVAPEGSKLEETNPYWQSKILGKFPERSLAGGLIPLSWIRAAQEKTLHAKDSDPNRIGVDVGAGGDSSVICHRHGPVFRILLEDKNPDTMQTCGNVVQAIEDTNADFANVDEIGIGKGIKDRGQEKDITDKIGVGRIRGINVGMAALDNEHFVNLRAELYWRLRERFEAGTVDLDPQDDDTAAELAEIRFKRLSNGKIQIESKDDMKKRGVPSPNRAEALMLANSELPYEPEWTIQ